MSGEHKRRRLLLPGGNADVSSPVGGGNPREDEAELARQFDVDTVVCNIAFEMARQERQGRLVTKTAEAMLRLVVQRTVAMMEDTSRREEEDEDEEDEEDEEEEEEEEEEEATRGRGRLRVSS